MSDSRSSSLLRYQIFFAVACYLRQIAHGIFHSCGEDLAWILRNCNIPGTIPSDFGSNTSLKYLDLSFSNLTSLVPKSRFNMPSLEFLSLWEQPSTWITAISKESILLYFCFLEIYHAMTSWGVFILGSTVVIISSKVESKGESETWDDVVSSLRLKAEKSSLVKDLLVIDEEEATSSNKPSDFLEV